MNRRQFFSALAIATFVTPAAFAQEDYLQTAFDALGVGARKSAQSQLAMGGFYAGQIDGVYGAGTQSALMNAAQFILDNSYDKVAFDLSSFDGAQKFVTALSREELGKYMFGEGDESAEG